MAGESEASDLGWGPGMSAFKAPSVFLSLESADYILGGRKSMKPSLLPGAHSLVVDMKPLLQKNKSISLCYLNCSV